MPCTTILDISQQEQAQMLAALRRARYGYLLALPVFSYEWHDGVGECWSLRF